MLVAKNPLINEAYNKLQVMSEDEANRMIYEARLKAQRDDYSRIQGALQQGLEKGRAEGEAKGRKEGREKGRAEGRKEGKMEGREEGREEIILQMAQHGMGVKDIAAITHLSEQEVGNILNGRNG